MAVGWKTAKHLPRACVGPHQTRGRAARRPSYETVSTGAGDGRRVEDCEASSTRLCRTTPNAWTCCATSTLCLDQAKRLTERRLVEAPQLARVQRVELATQQIQGGDADLQMLGHGSL